MTIQPVRKQTLARRRPRSQQSPGVAVSRACWDALSRQGLWCLGLGCVMDPVTLILAALSAGAGVAGGEVTKLAVKDGYERLKGLLQRTFAGNATAVKALANYEDDPATYELPLAEQLAVTGADQDAEIVAAAEEVVKAADGAGIKTKYNVTVSGGKVGIIGDHGTVTMN
jgi:hypothetical protein